jgi:hypothetical protein
MTYSANAVPSTQATTQADRDALALIKSTLLMYGLPESLADWAWSEIVSGKGNSEILLDLRNRPEFKAEFPEIDELARKNLTPMSPGDIVAYRQRAREMMRAAGLPEGFYDSKDDFSKFIANGVSASELANRIQAAQNAAYNAPAEVRDTLAEWGLGHGDLTAFWLDPDKAQPMLERKYAAAQIAGAGKRTGYGSLDEATATDLAQIGVTADQAQAGFDTLASSRELFTPLDGGEDAITKDEQLAATFRGNAAAQERISRRAAKRRAVFAAGGGFAEGNRGVVGLGRADQ